MRFLKLSKEYFFVGLKGLLQYKYLIITNTFANLLFLTVSYFLWAYLFNLGYTQINGFTLNDFFLYYAVMLFVSYFFMPVEQHLSQDINSGRLLLYLTRNVNPIHRYYFDIVGWNLFGIIFIGIVLCILLIFLSKFNILLFILFLFSIIFAAIVNTLFFGIVGLIAFKTQKIQGIVMNINIIVGFLSGSWLPLNFFPQTIQNIFYFLPFQYTKYFPAMLLLDKLEPTKIILGFLVCIIWSILLFYIFKKLYKKATKSFEGHGG